MRTILDAEPFGYHEDSAFVRTVVFKELDCGKSEEATEGGVANGRRFPRGWKETI